MAEITVSEELKRRIETLVYNEGCEIDELLNESIDRWEYARKLHRDSLPKKYYDTEKYKLTAAADRKYGINPEDLVPRKY